MNSHRWSLLLIIDGSCPISANVADLSLHWTSFSTHTVPLACAGVRERECQPEMMNWVPPPLCTDGFLVWRLHFAHLSWRLWYRVLSPLSFLSLFAEKFALEHLVFFECANYQWSHRQLLVLLQIVCSRKLFAIACLSVHNFCRHNEAWQNYSATTSHS